MPKAKAWYQYSGPPSSHPRNLSIGAPEDEQKKLARVAREAPRAVPMITFQDGGTYHLLEGEFPGLMSKSRGKGWGSLKQVSAPEQPKPATTKKRTTAVKPKPVQEAS